jgi:hypothetical protein
MKLCPKIILEGTRLTHKTDIGFALNEPPRIVGPRKYRYHSPLVSAEWCGFTNYPWGRGLINFEAHEEALAMETYRTWVRLFGQLRYYSWIVDRFHISTQVHQLIHYGRQYDFAWLEHDLKELGFIGSAAARAIVCPGAVERVKISANPLSTTTCRYSSTAGVETNCQASCLDLPVDISDDDVPAQWKIAD